MHPIRGRGADNRTKDKAKRRNEQSVSFGLGSVSIVVEHSTVTRAGP